MKYERFCLDTLTVKAVTPEGGGEWLIEFIDKRYQSICLPGQKNLHCRSWFS
jgi:hypothetical protein